MSRRPALTAVLAGLAIVAWAQPSAGTATPSSCRGRGSTVLANVHARVYTLDRGDIEVYACRYSTRSIRQHAPLGARGTQVGTSRFRLEGFYAGSLVRGEGCAREGCVGDFIQLVDTRRPEQPYNQRRRLPGRVFALRSDGVFATVTEPQDGSPAVVNVWDRHGAREVGRGDIPPASLALGPNAVYWTVGGAPQTAAATGPIR